MNTPIMTNLFAANIPKFFLHTVFKGIGFGLMTAMWVIYLQERRGLNLAEAAIVDVTFFVAAAFAEVPTGMVADTYGRKTSLTLGAALMAFSMFAWAFAPSLLLIIVAYVALAVGTTFLSGAEEAFLYETLQLTGRGDDYTRLLGRVSATMMAAMALGSVASGLLATVDLIVPFLAAGFSLLISFGMVLTFKEPRNQEPSNTRAQTSYRSVLQQAFALMRSRPRLRYPILYLSLVPVAALILETLFVQPQAVALGVPLAGIGVVVMVVQLTNIAGSTWAEEIKNRLGEKRVLYLAPVLIVSSLLLLAAFQVLPALFFIVVIGVVTAVLRPLVMNRIQHEVSDNIRATMLSMQSLLFTIVAAITQPTLAFIADESSLSAAYFALATALGLLIVILFWRSRRHFP